MNTRLRWLLTLLLACAPSAHLRAGGSGLNVAVVVNQNSTNSVQLGNYYCEQRQVPPQNYLRMTNWAGGNVQWTNSDFTNSLLNPLLSMLASQQLTTQIDYVVLSMDIPYKVLDNDGSQNSTTSALFYGFKHDTGAPGPGVPASCSLPNSSSNSYAGSECIFRSSQPATATTNSFLAVMITSSNLDQAKAVIDHGVASDDTYPQQTVVLAKTTDTARNIRYAEFDNAIFNTRLCGNYSMLCTNTPSSPYVTIGSTNLLGYQTGLYSFTTLPNGFVPGAMADSLTSYGGYIYDSYDSTSLLAFLNAGASGSYGTIIEPCAYLEKFPSANNYFFQARGFSLAECYYQSITNPYQGLIVGEPLAAPFAQAPVGAWNNLPVNALLSGTTNLSLQFTASDTNHPVQQVDLFVDGTWLQTLTNVAPQRYNILNVTINGTLMKYTVPASATVKSVTAGLTSTLNTKSTTTKVTAFAHGDRIELQSTDSTKTGAQVSLAVSNSIGTAAALTTWIAASGTNILDTIANGILGYQVGNAPTVGSYLQFKITKTNSVVVTVAVTNAVSGIALSAFMQALVDEVNTNSALQGSDGLTADDFIANSTYAKLNLRARSLGWNASQIQVTLSGSSPLSISPSGSQTLVDNIGDLEPRAHLYITAGLTNFPFNFAFNTTTLADGFHELTAVGYEGSHVHTQTRVAQNVVIQNSSLSATFTTPLSASNVAVEATLQFSITANTNNVTKIELFSTGGSLGSVAGVSNATFSIAGTSLDIGLHPFYGIVTASSVKQYRTQTMWMRLVGADSPFQVSIAAPPPVLSWPATAGRSYDILETTDLTQAFQTNTTFTPTNSFPQWTDPDPLVPQRFYRVRTSD